MGTLSQSAGGVETPTVSRKFQKPEKEELFQNLLGQIAEQFSRVFKINELKTEVANHLAMLEKKVELEGLKVVEIEKCKRDIKKMREEMAARSSSCGRELAELNCDAQ
ncbi:hypothetical protein EK904_001974 [Melospiza melodia maxima]|nr:hypothetical protein EK904_001974 [Melospiza melodia maxima]